MPPGDQLPLPLPHRAALGRADFLVAPSNAAAVAWIDRWPDWPSTALCLHGPQGCGKSHLLTVWCASSGAERLTGVELADRDPAALSAMGCVAIDEADGAADERVLLHLFNLLKEAGGQLLLAARTPATYWSLQLPDLRSRLVSSASVAMEAPDDALLSAILAKLFRDRQVAVDDGVLRYLVSRMERSFAAAAELVERLDRQSLAGRRAITITLVRAALEQKQTRDQERTGHR